MLIVQVFLHVKENYVQSFKAATIENARNSVLETGIARFDVIQNADDPTRFALIEVYRTPEDIARHKETAHYATWRDTVEAMLEEPRTRVQYKNIFPDENGWD